MHRYAGVPFTECSTATWNHTTGLSIAYPAPALHSHPRILHSDADPVVAFSDLLRREITARPLSTDGCAVELSSGLDSAMTALALASGHGASELYRPLALEAALRSLAIPAAALAP